MDPGIAGLCTLTDRPPTLISRVGLRRACHLLTATVRYMRNQYSSSARLGAASVATPAADAGGIACLHVGHRLLPVIVRLTKYSPSWFAFIPRLIQHNVFCVVVVVTTWVACVIFRALCCPVCTSRQLRSPLLPQRWPSRAAAAAAAATVWHRGGFTASGLDLRLDSVNRPGMPHIKYGAVWEDASDCNKQKNECLLN